MKYYIFNFLAVIFLGVLIEGCSDLQTNIPPAANKVIIHKVGFADQNSPNFHGKYIQDNNWDMRPCQQCHAANYTGGMTDVACVKCHTEPSGPEACNTCHGDLTDPSKIAPPRGIDGSTSTSSMYVGAHSYHLNATIIGKSTTCQACHVVPTKVYDKGHLDGSPVVTFGEYANSQGATNAAFNSTTGSCSNTYCHGNFTFSKANTPSQFQYAFQDSVIVGNHSNTVIWNASLDGSQIKCGSCHETPPKGHIGYGDPRFDLTTCVGCHKDVVDAQGNIINKELHINGQVNVNQF